MEYLEGRPKANVNVIKSLLHASLNGVNISNVDSPLDGQKFKIEAEGRTMFLCVSREYLNDQTEARIHEDFKIFDIAGKLLSNPGAYFLLGNNGVQPITADAVKS